MTKDSMVFVGIGDPMCKFNTDLINPEFEIGRLFSPGLPNTNLPREPMRVECYLSVVEEGRWETKYPLQVDSSLVIQHDGKWGVLIPGGVITQQRDGYKFGPLEWLAKDTYLLAFCDLSPYYLAAYDLPANE